MTRPSSASRAALSEEHEIAVAMFQASEHYERDKYFACGTEYGPPHNRRMIYNKCRFKPTCPCPIGGFKTPQALAQWRRDTVERLMHRLDDLVDLLQLPPVPVLPGLTAAATTTHTPPSNGVYVAEDISIILAAIGRISTEAEAEAKERIEARLLARLVRRYRKNADTTTTTGGA